jgi:hypothetical protein
MKRLCVSLPNLDIARRVVSELHKKGVDASRLHLLAREGTELEDIKNTSIIDESDFLPAFERGIALGGTAGLLAGVASIVIPGSGIVAGGAAILLLTTVVGAGTAGYLTAIVGASVPNTRLHQFREALEEGEILLMFDVPRNEVDLAKEWVLQHHPDADILGVEPPASILPRE